MELVKGLLGQSKGRLMMGILPKNGKWFHEPAYNSAEAESVSSKYAEQLDVYVSCAVFDESGKRKKENAIESNAFWVDIDCGLGKPYPTKNDGRNALSEFLKVTGLPLPTHLNDSGNGLHVFWVLSQSVSPAEWEEKAKKLKELTHVHGFHVDDTRTSDIASVLRMPGTKNHKGRSNPKPVVSKLSNEPISPDSFITPLSEAYEKINRSKPVSEKSNSEKVMSLMQYMAQKEPRLHSGEWEKCETDLGTVGYLSQSEADYAYLGMYVRKAIAMGVPKADIPNIVLDAFRKSKLYREHKEHTLEPAVAKLLAGVPDETVTVHQSHSLDTRFNLRDGVVELTDAYPPPRKWVVNGLLLEGKSAILGGAGGTSKTMLALQASVDVVLGQPIFSHTVTSGKVLAFLGEDDREECSRRINAYVKTKKLSDGQTQRITSALRVFPMVGQDARLAKSFGGALETTGVAEEIINISQEFSLTDGEPVKLIVLDHAGLIHGGDFNAREDVVQTMSLVNRIAAETGAAVLLLAHTSKSAARKDDEASADDVAGNAAWVDLSRCVLMLRTLTESESKKFGISAEARKQYASLNVVKSNYAPIGDTIWLERRSVDGYGVGILEQVNLIPEQKLKTANGSDPKLRTRIRELVTENAALTKNKISNHAGKDGRLKASKASVMAEVDLMLNDGSLHLEAPTEEEKKRLGINANTSGLLRTGKGQK